MKNPKAYLKISIFIVSFLTIWLLTDSNIADSASPPEPEVYGSIAYHRYPDDRVFLTKGGSKSASWTWWSSEYGVEYFKSNITATKIVFPSGRLGVQISTTGDGHVVHAYPYSHPAAASQVIIKYHIWLEPDKPLQYPVPRVELKARTIGGSYVEVDSVEDSVAIYLKLTWHPYYYSNPDFSQDLLNHYSPITPDSPPGFYLSIDIDEEYDIFMRSDQPAQVVMSALGLFRSYCCKYDYTGGIYDCWLDPDIVVDHKQVQVHYEGEEEPVLVWADEVFKLHSNVSKIATNNAPGIPLLLLDD